MPKIALRRRVHDLGDAGVAGGDEHVGGADDVDRPEQVAVLGQRHLGDVVEHDVDAVARRAHGVEVADVADDDLDRLARRRGPGR